MKKLTAYVLICAILSFTIGLSVPVAAKAATEDIIYLDEDFSSDDYELNKAYSATEISAINPALGALGAGNNGDTTEKIYTVKSENGVNYLSMSSFGVGRITLAANITDSVTDGELVIEMKFREVGHNGAVDFGGYANDVHGLCCESSETATGWWYAAGGDSELYDRAAPARPEGGFYHTRTVWKRATTSEPWTVELYDINDGGKCISTKTVDLATLTGDADVDPTDLYFATKYCTSEDNVSIDLTALKVYKPGVTTIEAIGAYNSYDKTVVIECTDELEPATVNANTVKVTDSFGNKINAAARVSDGDIVVTTAVLLGKGTYTVELNGVETAGGKTLIGISCNFDAEDYFGPVVYLDESFSAESYELDKAYSAKEISAINSALGALGGGNNGDTEAKVYTVKSGTDGNYLSITGLGTTHGRVTLAANIEESITTGEVSVEMKFRASGSGGVGTGFGGYANDVHGFYSEPNSSIATGYWFAAGGESELYGNPSLTGAEDGFYHTRTVWSRTLASDLWTVKLYDINNNNNLLSTKEVDLATLTGDAEAEPTNLYFATRYCAGEDTVSMDLTALKIVYTPNPEIVDSDSQFCEPNAECFNFYVNADVDVSDLEISIKDDDLDDVVIGASFEYDADKKMISVYPESYLDYSSDYTITFAGTSIMPYGFTTAEEASRIVSIEDKYEDALGNPLVQTPDDGTYNVIRRVTVSNDSDIEKTFCAVMMAIDSQGMITAASKAEITSKKPTEIIEPKLVGIDVQNCASLKLLVFEKTNYGFVIVEE